MHKGRILYSCTGGKGRRLFHLDRRCRILVGATKTGQGAIDERYSAGRDQEIPDDGLCEECSRIGVRRVCLVAADGVRIVFRRYGLRRLLTLLSWPAVVSVTWWNSSELNVAIDSPFMVPVVQGVDVQPSDFPNFPEIPRSTPLSVNK